MGYRFLRDLWLAGQGALAAGRLTARRVPWRTRSIASPARGLRHLPALGRTFVGKHHSGMMMESVKR